MDDFGFHMRKKSVGGGGSLDFFSESLVLNKDDTSECLKLSHEKLMQKVK